MAKQKDVMVKQKDVMAKQNEHEGLDKQKIHYLYLIIVALFN